MGKKTLKGAALAAVLGTVLQFGGCISWQTLMASAATYAGLEFVLDNDGVFDLFESGNVAG
jgi:hypothetical protein